jgi:hypothetical protein
MAIAVQIDTTLYRSKISGSHGFQRFDHSFNRTVVSAHKKLPGLKFWTVQAYDGTTNVLLTQIKPPSVFRSDA